MKPVDQRLSLLDWRRRIATLYHEVRTSEDPRAAWEEWRRVRDHMFATHEQSPIPAEERSAFGGLELYAYDPGHRIMGHLEAASPRHYDIGTSGSGSMAFTRFASARFELAGQALQLELYWLEGYGGGLFVPFADVTSGDTTYGGGRYLFDTVKGADLGSSEARIVLDFNFAYNPSCAYDPKWVCPLTPAPNRLKVRIEAGERHPG